MISYPRVWQKIGREITIEEIISAIDKIIRKLGCFNLALSGGIDSTVMLAFMVKNFGKENIRGFNMALNKNHPDYVYSEIAANHFRVQCGHYIPDAPLIPKEGDLPGDENVRAFYDWGFSSCGVKRIIACDGIDEFMGGYYDHMKNPSEKTYYGYLRKLQEEQLIPLDFNSGNVEVLLPYIDDSVILLLSQIPYSEKFDSCERKKIMNIIARRLRIPESIVARHKYGFVDAMRIKS